MICSLCRTFVFQRIVITFNAELSSIKRYLNENYPTFLVMAYCFLTNEASKKRKLAIVIAVCAAIEDLEPQAPSKQRKCWVTPRLMRREELGCYNTLLRDLSLEDP